MEKTAKAEFEAFRASVAKAPVEKAPPPREAELSFDPSDLDEEMEKLEQAGKEQRRAAQGGLSAKLARLKAEPAPAGATPKKRRRAPSSANPAGEAGAKKRKPAPRGKRQEQAEEAPRSKRPRSLLIAL